MGKTRKSFGWAKRTKRTKLAKRRAQLAILAAALGFASWGVWSVRDVGETCGVGAVATAQETASNGERALAVVAKEPEKCAVLLVGVDKYKTLTSLQYASSDVRALRDALVEIGFPFKSIRTLVSDGDYNDRPSREAILATLDEILAASGPDSTVLIALSGHGFETENGDAAFCPEDVEVKIDDGKTAVKSETAILIEEVAERLRTDDARFKLLIVDACREPATTERAADATARSFNPIPEPNGVAFLQSCESQELSWEHPALKGGVFSAFFAKGLRGAADSDGDGGVSFLDVCNYATSQTQRFVKDKRGAAQTPFYRFSGVVDFWLKPPTRKPVPPISNGWGWLPLALLALTGGFAVWAYRLQTQMKKLAATETVGEPSRQVGEEAKERQKLDEADKLASDAWSAFDLGGFANVEKAIRLMKESLASVELTANRRALKTFEEKLEALRKASVAVPAHEVATPQTQTPRPKVAPAQPAQALNGWGAEYRAGTRQTLQIKGVEYAFRYCPPGTFLMGSPESEKGRYDDETQHEVTLTNGFWMLETPVTQAMWKSVMGNNPSWFSATGGGSNLVSGLDTSKFPVERVTWNDCQDFIKKLNSEGLLLDRFKFRLPSEAEWEYACRAGTTTAYFWGDSLNGDKANCNGNCPCGTRTKGNSLERTTKVGSYGANPWGLYDMHGNVCEWCENLYTGYNNLKNARNQINATAGSGWGLRGGSWFSYASRCRSACRSGAIPLGRSGAFGFRLALGREL